MRNDGLIKTFYADGTLEGRKLVTVGTGKLKVNQATAATDALIGVTIQIGTEEAGFVQDYGLEDHIPQQELDNATNSNFDPRGNVVELLTKIIGLDREKRFAAKVQDKNNDAHKETLSGTDQWSHADSKPLVALTDALETPIKRPNVMVTSRKIAVALRRNPGMVKAFNGSVSDDGLVPLSFVRELLEIDGILVGAAYYNSARPGHDMQLERLWGNHCSLIYRNPTARPTRGVTFGLTAEHGQQEIQNRMDAVMLYQHRKPLFERLGRAVLTEARLNFRRQHAPDGTPWAPLKIRTMLAFPGKNGQPIFAKTGEHYHAPPEVFTSTGAALYQ